MALIGDPPENAFDRFLRWLGYFLLGAFLGLVPAAWLVAATSAPHIRWKIPLLVVLGCGAFSWLLGALTRGRLLVWLLRFFGKDVDSWR